MPSKSSASSGSIGPEDISKLANLFMGHNPVDEHGQPMDIGEHLGVKYDDKVKDPKLFTPGEKFLYNMFGPSKARQDLENRKSQLAQVAAHLAPKAMEFMEKYRAVPPTFAGTNPAVNAAAGIAPPQLPVTMEGTNTPFDVDSILQAAPGARPPGFQQLSPPGSKQVYATVGDGAPADTRLSQVPTGINEPDMNAILQPHEKAAYAMALPKTIADHVAELNPDQQEGLIDVAATGAPGAVRKPMGLPGAQFMKALEIRQKSLQGRNESTQVLDTVDADGRPTRVLVSKVTGKVVNPELPAPPPNTKQMATQLESAAAVASKKAYGKVLTFAELASADPDLAQQVRQQAEIDEPKRMYEYQQGELAKRQVAVAPIIAESTARARGGVEADVRMTGPTMIMQELTPLVDKLFVPESAGSMARVQQAGKLRLQAADAQSDVTKWTRSIATAMRPQLARAEGEVGNLAAQEQLNAGELIPDPLGGTTSTFPFFKLPDTRETAIDRMKLATEFIELGAKAPNGERETSLVQQRLKGIKQQLNDLEQKKAAAYNKGEAPLGELSKAEFAVAQQLHAAGKSKAETEAAIRALRSKH